MFSLVIKLLPIFLLHGKVITEMTPRKLHLSCHDLPLIGDGTRFVAQPTLHGFSSVIHHSLVMTQSTPRNAASTSITFM